MLTATEQGLYCAAGNFHVDPFRRVERALITHAHSDHARPGHRAYLCAAESVGVLRVRLGRKAAITGLPYGATTRINQVAVSFHPAGHLLGSAQIRIEHRGEVWVVSGDYKTQPDPTCSAFQPLRCHTFITESTFALPIYRWPDPATVFAEINDWWQCNQREGRISVLFGYSLGKAQRLLAGVDAGLGPILVHHAVRDFLPAYETAGVSLPPTQAFTKENLQTAGPQALIVAPPAATESTWLQSLGEVSAGFASGWMLIRSMRWRRRADRGFTLSDHADWPGLLTAIEATGAERVLVTHGAAAPLVRWLNETGRQAEALVTRSANETEPL